MRGAGGWFAGEDQSVPRRPGPPSPTQLDRAPLPVVHLARDHARPHVAERVRHDDWEPVRPGAYTDTAPGEDVHARRRRHALARILAVAEQTSAEVTFTLASAALLWGLPLHTVPEQTHVAQLSRPTTHGAPDIVRHHLHVPGDQRAVRHGLPVTSLERNLVDCAQALQPLAGLIVADAALHVGADPAVCAELLAARRGQRGVVRAREILTFADAGAESPGETTLRFMLLVLGLPVPETQIRISTPAGTFWSDLGWREAGLLCEYDGQTKYGANGTATDAVLREKRRQDAVEEEGWRMLRIVREDLRSRPALLGRVRRLMPNVLLTPRPLLNTT